MLFDGSDFCPLKQARRQAKRRFRGLSLRVTRCSWHGVDSSHIAISPSTLLSSTPVQQLGFVGRKRFAADPPNRWDLCGVFEYPTPGLPKRGRDFISVEGSALTFGGRRLVPGGETNHQSVARALCCGQPGIRLGQQVLRDVERQRGGEGRAIAQAIERRCYHQMIVAVSVEHVVDPP
jgi:hypothetical protein